MRRMGSIMQEHEHAFCIATLVRPSDDRRQTRRRRKKKQRGKCGDVGQGSKARKPPTVVLSPCRFHHEIGLHFGCTFPSPPAIISTITLDDDARRGLLNVCASVSFSARGQLPTPLPIFTHDPTTILDPKFQLGREVRDWSFSKEGFFSFLPTLNGSNVIS